MSTETPVISPKKLIEVALPLDAINAAAAREKSIRHGHPFDREPGWGVSSINYNLEELLQRCHRTQQDAVDGRRPVEQVRN